jgi:hypothetical protein
VGEIWFRTSDRSEQRGVEKVDFIASSEVAIEQMANWNAVFQWLRRCQRKARMH